MSLLYAGIVLSASDRTESAEELGSLAALGCATLLAGVILLAGSLIKADSTIRLPYYWLGLIAFFILISLGMTFNYLELFAAASPVLVVFAACSLAVFYAGLMLRWAMGKRQSRRALVNPAVFGMTGSVVLAVSLQILFACAMFVGAFLGFKFAGVDFPSSSSIQDLFAEFEEGSNSLPDLFFTPTVVFSAFALFVIVAPLTEELTKFFGAFIPFIRHQDFSLFTIFFAGSMAGLGFATTENIGYALLSPSAWAVTLLLRAPVVLVHMAASSIVALGWYQQRQSGGIVFVWYFMLAVALHGSFNSVAVSVTMLAGSIGADTTPSVLSALALLGLIGAAGALLTGSLAWLMLNARRFGNRAEIQRASEDFNVAVSPVSTSELYASSYTRRAVGSSLN